MAEGFGALLGGGALGALFVKLMADSSHLVKGMKEGEEAVKSGADRIQGQLNIISKAAVGAFTAAGGAVAYFIKEQIDAAAEMGKTAQRAGQQVEAFSGLAAAAHSAGVDAGELALASKFLAQWMEKTGKDSQNLTKEILDQADAFSKMEDGSAKVRLAVERFSRAGIAMIPFLNQGSEAIREQMEEAKLFNAVIGPEFAENAEKYNGNLNRINTAFKGIFNRVAEELLPVLLEMQKQFIDWIKETDGVNVAAGFLLEVIDNLVFAVKSFALGLLTVWTALKSIATIIRTVVTVAFGILEIHIKGMIALAQAWWEGLQGIIKGLSRAGEVARNVADLMAALVNRDFKGAIIASAKIVAAEAKGWVDITNAVKGGVEKAANIVIDTVGKDTELAVGLSEAAVGDISKQWSKWADMGAKLLQPVEVQARKVAEVVKKVTQDIAANSEEARKLLDKVGLPTVGFLDTATTESFGLRKERIEGEAKLKLLEDFAARQLTLDAETKARLVEALEQHNQKIKALQYAQAQVVLQSGQEMFSALADAAKGYAGEQSSIYKTLFAASKAFAIAESIVKIQQGIANALSLPFPANLVAAASVVTAAANIVSTIESISLKFGGEKALGGPVSPGKAFLVGERGPELFSPASHGSIIPNNQLGIGKVIINNYTDVRPEVAERHDAEGKIMEITLRRLKSDIGSEIREGRGDVSRAMEASFGLRRKGT